MEVQGFKATYFRHRALVKCTYKQTCIAKIDLPPNLYYLSLKKVA